MNTVKKEIFQKINEITRVVSFKKEGQIEEVRYYCHNEEISSELYDWNGVLVHREGKIPNCVVREHYKTGAIKSEIPFEDGKAHGKGIDYYPTGEIREENTFRKGLLHGSSITYRRNGLLWIESYYNDGNLHGIYKSYHDNGCIETISEYSEGNLNGYYSKYDRYGGLMESGTFCKGKKHGEFRSYYETGQIAKLEKYWQEKLIIIEEFDEDGRVIK